MPRIINRRARRVRIQRTPKPPGTKLFAWGKFMITIAEIIAGRQAEAERQQQQRDTLDLKQQLWQKEIERKEAIIHQIENRSVKLELEIDMLRKELGLPTDGAQEFTARSYPH